MAFNYSKSATKTVRKSVKMSNGGIIQRKMSEAEGILRGEVIVQRELFKGNS